MVPILGFRESSVNYELAFFDSDLGIEFAVYHENRNLHLPPIFSRVEIEVLAIRFNHCRRRILPSRRNSCAEEPEGSTKLLQTRDLQNPTEFLTPWVFVDKLLECLLFDTADTSTDRSDSRGKVNYVCHLY